MTHLFRPHFGGKSSTEPHSASGFPPCPDKKSTPIWQSSFYQRFPKTNAHRCGAHLSQMIHRQAKSPGKKHPYCFFCPASIPQRISFGKSFYYVFLIYLTSSSYNSSDMNIIHDAVPRTQAHRASAPAPRASAACSHVREGAPFPKSQQRPPRTS